MVNCATRTGFWRSLPIGAIRKPSPHTVKAYRQDFTVIAMLLAGGPERVAELTPDVVTKDALQAAFAAYADTMKLPRSGAVGRTGTRCATSYSGASSSH